MKTIKAKFLLMLMLIVGASSAFAQRAITGTVYLDGEPAAGVEVVAHKGSGSYFTSFDGKYELEISAKSKYIKFIFPDVEERLDIEGKTESVFDYYRGEKPVAKAAGGIDLRSHSELASKDKNYQQVYSMYNQFMKQKDYKSALPSWETLYKTYPKSSLNIYLKGITMYDSFIKAASGAEREELIAKEMEIFDQRAKYFGDEVNVMGRKAVKMLELTVNDNMTDSEKAAAYKKAYPMLENAVKSAGDEATFNSMIQLMNTTRQLYQLGAVEAEKVIEVFDMTNTVLENKLAANPDAKTIENITKSQNAINRSFEISGAADCDALVALYQPKFEANPNDMDLLNKMMKILSRNECTESDLFLQGAEKVYEAKPSASSAVLMAQRYAKLGDKSKALDYYKEALSMEDADDDMKARINFGMAAIYISQKNFPAARTAAKTAASQRENFGAAYKLAGDAYFYGASTLKTPMEKSEAYWVASDYYNKAARADASIAADARSKAAACKKYFPAKNDLFFEGIELGSKRRVGGWINETTTVRSKD